MNEGSEFHELKNFIPDLITQGLLIHKHGKVLFANKPFLDVTGYSIEKLLKCENWIELVGTTTSNEAINQKIKDKYEI